MDTRKKELLYLFEHVKKDTITIMDDLQFLDYSRLVRRYCKEKHVKIYSLRSITKDKNNRFAVMLVKS